MSWTIRAYEASGDRLLHEYALEDVLRRLFRGLLHLAPDDPMIDSYPLPDAAVVDLVNRLSIELKDSPEVEYFLDWDA